MEQLIRATAEFDASHTDSSRVRCMRPHGHHWTVTVEKRITGDPADLEVDLHALIAEWQDRDLDEMLHIQGLLSPSRLASWTMERLLLRHPTIVRVEFGEGRLTGVVTQELRR